MRLLVCGGRDFNDVWMLCTCLEDFRDRFGITTLIHGAARGADAMAAYWAKPRGIEVVPFHADWHGLGLRAGPTRNREMLAIGKPDAVLAFPGGAGTADMVTVARHAGLPIWKPGPDHKAIIWEEPCLFSS